MKTMTPQVLQTRLAEGNPPYLIDIRPVSGEVLPVDSQTSLEDIQTGVLPNISKDMPILVICTYGRVSELAGAYLEAAGFTDVYNLAGGVRAWQQVVQVSSD
ncbi:MAG: rhodanese-like domain-containing protein [Deinococcota bacterium]